MDVALTRLIRLKLPAAGETVVSGIHQAIGLVRRELHPGAENEGHWLKADLALSSALTWADHRLVDLATQAVEEALAYEGWLRDAAPGERSAPETSGARDVYAALREWRPGHRLLTIYGRADP
jgi:hypothetical protein